MPPRDVGISIKCDRCARRRNARIGRQANRTDATDRLREQAARNGWKSDRHLDPGGGAGVVDRCFRCVAAHGDPDATIREDPTCSP